MTGKTTDTYRERLSPGVVDAVAVAGIALPVIVSLYALLVLTKIIPSLGYIGSLETTLLLATWLFGAVAIYSKRRSTLFGHPIHFTLHHVFLGIFIVLLSGFDASVTYLWPVLTVGVYLYYGTRGVIASLISLFVILMVSIVETASITNATLHVVDYVILAAISLIASAILTRNQVDNRELNASFKKATTQHDSLLAVVNSMTSAVIGVDTAGKVTLYNAATLSLLDTNTELTKQSIDTVLPLTDVDKNQVSVVEMLNKANTVFVDDSLLLPLDDEYLRLNITISPVKSSYSAKHRKHDTRGYILILRDVTREKSLEEEKDEFISVVSHELRTPITVAEGTISNALALMQQNSATKQKTREAVDLAHEQVIFLAKMVNDLSTLSRAERGFGDATEPIDVKEMVEDMYREYQPQAEAKGLTLNLDMVEKVGTVRASRLYLKELLQNFITNSLKYTRKGSITVAVSRENDAIRFAVKDTGIGISKSDQKHIFERFFRSEDYRTRETGGTGLGLYVANKLAKKLGTHIHLKSRLNHGSTFWIELPVINDDVEP